MSSHAVAGEFVRIGFDADPHPSVSHVVGIADATKFPVVEARVQSLPSVVRDEFSLGGLRNWVYPVDRLVQANAGEILAYKDLVLKGGLHGSEMTFDVVLSGVSNPMAGGSVIRVTQIAVVDPSTNKLYLFMLRCESHCYRDNKSLLDTIVRSSPFRRPAVVTVTVTCAFSPFWPVVLSIEMFEKCLVDVAVAVTGLPSNA